VVEPRVLVVPLVGVVVGGLVGVVVGVLVEGLVGVLVGFAVFVAVAVGGTSVLVGGIEVSVAVGDEGRPKAVRCPLSSAM
jgi:hypothetical protein